MVFRLDCIYVVRTNYNFFAVDNPQELGMQIFLKGGGCKWKSYRAEGQSKAADTPLAWYLVFLSDP
jgi:hypothetical protein